MVAIETPGKAARTRARIEMRTFLRYTCVSFFEKLEENSSTKEECERQADR
jgi:hypothetical protein